MKAFNNCPEKKAKLVSKLVSNSLRNKENKVDLEKLGIPEWLINVYNVFKENVANPQNFSLRFFESIKPGVDLNNAEAPFVIYILKSLHKNYDTKKYPDVKKSIDVCIDLYEKGDLKESAAWSAAESAAESAARSAAWSAAESAAESAARSAAESAAYENFAETLINIIKEIN